MKPQLFEEEESVGGNELVDGDEESGEGPDEEGDPREEPLDEDDPK